MKNVAIFFCICLIAAEGFAGEKQVVQFPDTNLERVVRQALNLSATQQIYDVDVAGIKELHGWRWDIVDAKGIETLTGLRGLYLPANDLTHLNVSSCTNLQFLFCWDNKLTNLTISSCTDLRNLSCWSNQLTVLDISSNRLLTYVYATNNPLTNIVVWWTPPSSSNIPAPLHLYYSGNPTFSNPSEETTRFPEWLKQDIGTLLHQDGQNSEWNSHTLKLGDTGFKANAGYCLYDDRSGRYPDFYSIDVEYRIGDKSYVCFQRDIKMGDLPKDFDDSIEKIAIYNDKLRQVVFKIGKFEWSYTLPESNPQ